MLLSFNRRFEPHILDHSTTHTIRAPRKHPIRAWHVLDCYVDARQKSMRLIGRWRCTKVEPITIDFDRELRYLLSLKITIAGVRLSDDEAEAFAWRDGFREPGRSSRQQMLDFWCDANREFPWSGEVIHWDPTVAIEKPDMKAAA